MATFLVDTVADAGPGSLRQAILDANAAPGADDVDFEIGTGLQTIRPLSALPTVTGSLAIDGATQPGFAGTPLIALVGNLIVGSADGLTIAGGASLVRALNVAGFSGRGVVLTGPGGNRVERSFLGTDPTGRQPLGNLGDGLAIVDSADNTIGGAVATARNVISANGSNGVRIAGANATRNSLLGNLIGLDATGTSALGNGADGVIVADAPANLVGRAAIGAGLNPFRNVISANGIGLGGHGVRLIGTGSIGNVVAGNLIGTGDGAIDSVLLDARGNALSGLSIQDAAGNRVVANLLGANLRNGIEITGNSPNTLIQGNAIGTSLFAGTGIGTQPLDVGNARDGIVITGGVGNTIGGPNAAARNVVAASGSAPNTGNGIRLNSGSGNLIQGNFVGTNASGQIALPNGQNGVFLSGSADNRVVGNLLSANLVNGLRIAAAGGARNLVVGNRIGTDAAGTIALGNVLDGIFVTGAPANTIGGAGVGEGNLVAASGINGILVSGLNSTDNLLVGNVLGAGAGDQALGNSGDGLRIGSARNTALANRSSNNRGSGIVITGSGATGTVVQDNLVGTDAAGASNDRGNLQDGIVVDGVASATLGGSARLSGNVVTGNRGAGIRLTATTTSVLVEGNSVGLSTTAGVGRGGNAQEGLFVAGSLHQIGPRAATTDRPNVVAANGAAGILLQAATSVVVRGNRVGTDAVDTPGLGNARSGILLNGSAGNTIGGLDPGGQNVVAANRSHGIELTGAGSTANLIINNAIGLGAIGTALGNFDSGIFLDGAPANTIGGDAVGARNLIAANRSDGLAIVGPGAAGNRVIGNFIGTDQSGSAPSRSELANGQNGVRIDRAPGNVVGGNGLLGQGNVIVRSGAAGVAIRGAEATGNLVAGNRIGLDDSGTTAIGNRQDGVSVDSSFNTIGGTIVGEGNVSSGNGLNGIALGTGAASTVVIGNTIGLDSTGTFDRGNASNGILVLGADNVVGIPTARNLISGNDGHGVLISGPAARGNRLVSNAIGLDAGGLLDRGNALSGVFINNAPNNEVGAPGAGNLIAGNDLFGVQLAGPLATGNRVVANFVGTNGSQAIGNGLDGINLSDAPGNTLGGAAIGEGNVVSGNAASGIQLAGIGTRGTIVVGNRVGTDPSGRLPIANGADGLLINGAPGTIVGGLATAEGNQISGNRGVGLRVFGVAGSAGATVVLGNRVGTNADGTSALGNVGAGAIVQVSDGTRLIGNLFSGNGAEGLALLDGAIASLAAANRIGTDLSGTRAIPNGTISLDGAGLVIGNADGNTIGGLSVGSGNLISGHRGAGVRVIGSATANRIVGNRIGTTADGRFDLGNDSGVFIEGAAGNTIGGSEPGAGNLASGNATAGIRLAGAGATRNLIAGNFAGVDVTGSIALRNGSGILVEGAPGNTIGGIAPGSGNLASGNDAAGVQIVGRDAVANLVLGNTLGAAAGGFGRPLPRVATDVQDLGLLVNDAPLTFAAFNFIGGNQVGINLAGFNATGNLVASNLIGVGPDGRTAVPNVVGVYVNGSPGNTIGGVATGLGNVISGNTSTGVIVFGALSSRNVVAGNFVGTDITGTRLVPNDVGVFLSGASDNTVGGATAGAGNLIAGNRTVGVYAFDGAVNNQIQANRIGVDSAGRATRATANKQYGVLFFNAANNRVVDAPGGRNQNVGSVGNFREFTGVVATTRPRPRVGAARRRG